MEGKRLRVLLIGADFLLFHLYWRRLSKRGEWDIKGFVDPEMETPNIHSFQGYQREPLPIHPLKSLGRVIQSERIHRCIICQGVTKDVIQKVFNVALGSGTCSVEYLLGKHLEIHCLKPVITLLSVDLCLLWKFLEVCQCEGRKASVIQPILRTDDEFEVFHSEDCPHFRYTQEDEVTDPFVRSLFERGVKAVFRTGNIRNGMIEAEQCSDIVFYVAPPDHIPHTEAQGTVMVPNTFIPSDLDSAVNLLTASTIFTNDETPYPQSLLPVKILPLDSDQEFRPKESVTLVFNAPKLPEMHAEKMIVEYLKQYLPNKPILQKHFEEVTDTMGFLEEWSHAESFVSNSHGANRQSFIRLFLNSHLPHGFRIVKGEITDRIGNSTGKLGIVILDREAPWLTTDRTGQTIAPIIADNVQGVVDVKSTLSTDTLNMAFLQMRPVKCLMPSNGRSILAGVVAFHAASGTEKRVATILQENQYILDYVIYIGHFGFFRTETLRKAGISISCDESIKGYVLVRTKGMEMALLVGLLNVLSDNNKTTGLSYLHFLEGTWPQERGTECVSPVLVNTDLLSPPSV